MASKRSQVSQLDPIRSVTPVARGVDTFVLTKPRPVEDSALQVLDALSQLSPTLANLGQKGRDIKEKQRLEALEQRQKLEKSELTSLFTRDPIKFLGDLKDGKFRGMTDVSQMLAGEYAGKALARNYGSDLIQEYYQSQEMLNSQDENDMFLFETDFRKRFIDINAEIFSLPGAAEGFSSVYRQYTSQLDSAHMSKARENRVANQTQGFKTNVFTILDGFANDKITASDFKTRIRQGQDDYMVGFGFKPGQANLATLKAISEYVTSGATDFETSREILQLAKTIETSPGSYLAKTVEGKVLLAEALTKIDDMERQAEQQMHTDLTQEQARATLKVKGIIEKYMKNFSVNDTALESVTIETILAQEGLDVTTELAYLDTYFPTYRRYLEEQKNFFMREAQEVPSEDVIAMRIELIEMETTEEALDKITEWQRTGRLKNNREVYNKLFTQAQGINELPKEKEKDWTKDTQFKNFYRRLALTDYTTGFSIFPAKDPRNDLIGEFTDEFFKLFYTDAYSGIGVTIAQQNALIRPIFLEYQRLISEYEPPEPEVNIPDPD